MWLADDERTDADTDVRWAFAYSSALSMPIHIVLGSLEGKCVTFYNNSFSFFISSFISSFIYFFISFFISSFIYIFIYFFSYFFIYFLLYVPNSLHMSYFRILHICRTLLSSPLFLLEFYFNTFHALSLFISLFTSINLFGGLIIDLMINLLIYSVVYQSIH